MGIGRTKGAKGVNTPKKARILRDYQVAGGSKLEVAQDTVYISGPNVLGYVHGVGAAAGNSDHVEEERNIWTPEKGILHASRART